MLLTLNCTISFHFHVLLPKLIGMKTSASSKKHKNVFIRLFLHTLITYWWELLSWFFGVLNLVTKTYWKENYRSGKSVDGGWSAWSLWSTCICDHISGTGTKMRTRSCTNPAPFCHGLWVLMLSFLDALYLKVMSQSPLHYSGDYRIRRHRPTNPHFDFYPLIDQQL